MYILYAFFINASLIHTSYLEISKALFIYERECVWMESVNSVSGVESSSLKFLGIETNLELIVIWVVLFWLMIRTKCLDVAVKNEL